MTVNRTVPAYAATHAPALPAARTGRARADGGRDGSAPAVRDLRERPGSGPRALLFGPRDLVVVTGLPGSGKSTLIHRAADGLRIDSQDARDRFEARLPGRLPYALYRPLVRLAHYAALRRALATGEPVVVHDCGTQTWVRSWLARAARRRGAALHLLLLDVTPEAALQGQHRRGRGVSRHAFARHRRSAARLLRAIERGEVPAGCGSVVLLDRAAAGRLHRIGFTGEGAGGTR
ncbi:AAA family ATPase [Streptomyces sp. e14]|uniref:AAA family ATPase n=1 Tax=Streptomyces sp. e14 TaxID=645465 RepID=UPI0005BA7BD9|nr:AAA family ATPase [Streptomyces sp. e14]